jgi:Tfp pilus assembly protein PilV
MVCLVILSIAILGLVSAQIYSLKVTTGNKMRHTASVIATTLMNEKEEALRANFSQSAAQPRIAFSGAEGFEYAISEEIVDTNFKKIDVDVYWTENGIEHTYSIWTNLYNYETRI